MLLIVNRFWTELRLEPLIFGLSRLELFFNHSVSSLELFAFFTQLFKVFRGDQRQVFRQNRRLEYYPQGGDFLTEQRLNLADERNKYLCCDKKRQTL